MPRSFRSSRQVFAIADVYVRDGFGTREFFNQTTVHPIGLAVLGTLSFATLFATRRYMLLPLLVLACVVPQGQRVVLAGLDFNFIRIMLLVGFARVFLRGEWGHIRPKPLDKIVVAWVFVGAIGNILQVGDVQRRRVSDSGSQFDILGIYFMCRVAFRDWRDVDRATTCLALDGVRVVLLLLRREAHRPQHVRGDGGRSRVHGRTGGQTANPGPVRSRHPRGVLLGCSSTDGRSSKVLRKDIWQIANRDRRHGRNPFDRALLRVEYAADRARLQRSRRDGVRPPTLHAA